MSNDVNRQWLLVRRPEDNIRPEDFRLTETPIPTPEQGQVLVRNLWLSFDPTQRGWMTRDTYVPMIPLGDVMRAASVGQVIQSKHSSYKPGEFVQGAFGWQDYIATDGTGFIPMRNLPPGVPPNLALSLFGITGPTAYFGVLDVGQLKAGETFVVSGAAGATGSVAGQIAKIKGCRVIGTAGGKTKCDWLKNELGFDGVIDYHSEDVGAQLSALCPDGIDVFCSRQDYWYLGVGILLLSPFQGCYPVAGYGGFEPAGATPEDSSLYANLRQYHWQPGLEWTGNNGGHYGSYQQGFLRSVVLPLLHVTGAADQLSAREIAGETATH